MDASLQTALRALKEDFTSENCQRYAVTLLRSGSDAEETLQHLQNIYGEALKEVLVKELSKWQLPETKFIIRDPALEMLDDYQGHVVKKPGMEIGYVSSSYWANWAKLGSDRNYQRVCLLPKGIFLFEVGSTRRELNERTTKIQACERSEYPLWDSRQELPEGYVKFADIALQKLKAGTSSGPRAVLKNQTES